MTQSGEPLAFTGWPRALLVSETARSVIEGVPNAGVIFDPVVDA
jgi:hypothetical protein